MADGQHDLRNAAITHLAWSMRAGSTSVAPAMSESYSAPSKCVGPPFLFELCRRGFGDGTLADWLSAGPKVSFYHSTCRLSSDGVASASSREPSL